MQGDSGNDEARTARHDSDDAEQLRQYARRSRAGGVVFKRIITPSPMFPTIKLGYEMKGFESSLVRMALLLWLCAAGCSLRTQLSDGLGVASPDGKLRVAVASAALPGHAYSEIIEKDFTVFIYKLGDVSPIYRKSYKIKSGNLEWRTQWISSNEVFIYLLDAAAPSPIRSLRYQVDSSGTVVELR